MIARIIMAEVCVFAKAKGRDKAIVCRYDVRETAPTQFSCVFVANQD